MDSSKMLKKYVYWHANVLLAHLKNNLQNSLILFVEKLSKHAQKKSGRIYTQYYSGSQDQELMSGFPFCLTGF